MTEAQTASATSRRSVGNLPSGNLPPIGRIRYDEIAGRRRHRGSGATEADLLRPTPYNSGDRTGAKRVIAEFEDYEAVVAPSGYCTGMIWAHYPALFANEPAWVGRAKALSAKTFELTQFLIDILRIETLYAKIDGAVAYHDSCSSRREMHVVAQPRVLLTAAGADVRDVEKPEEYCGFSGTFCIKNADISGAMVDERAKATIATGADTLLAGDLGCLLNIAGRLKRLGSEIKVRHVAEALAGDTQTPSIGKVGK